MLSRKMIEKLERKEYAAVILAADIGALGILRELGKRSISCIVIGNEFIQKSKYTTAAIQAQTKEDVVNILLKIPHLLKVKLVLFTDADEYLEIIYSNWDQLINHYQIPASKNNFKLVDKEELALFAEESLIKVPKTFYKIEDINSSEYPVIVKPLIHSRMYIKSRIQTEKAYICYNKEQLIRIVDFLRKLNKPFITQQMIEGEVNKIYEVLIYRGKDGKIKIGYVAKKLRSFPPNFGVGSAQITEYNPHLIQASVSLMELTDYIGVAEFEYKFCEKSNQYYLIEVNGRFPLQSGLLHKVNSGFIPGIFRDLVFLPDDDNSSIQIDKKVVWVYLPSDIRAIRKEKKKLLPIYLKLLKTYSIQDALWSWKDPLPIFYYAKYILKRIYERVREKSKQNNYRRLMKKA